MSGRLLDDQNAISHQFPMSVDDVSASSSVQAVSGETVQLYYSSTGVRTTDAGQAAGTAVAGRFANKNILDSQGGSLGCKNDTSLSFTSTALTSEVVFPTAIAETVRKDTWANKLSAITSGFSNGQYCVDYSNGVIYGVKASTGASLTSTAYSINQAQTGSAGSLSTTVDITKLGGLALIADDAAFTPATSMGLPIFAFADEAATDSVNEGDVGVVRMTLDRKLQTYDSSTVSIDGKITACNTGAVVLTTSTASIGKLASNTGIDIGDVDILSIAAGDTNIGNVDIVSLPAGNLGQKTSAASLSVTPATDVTDATYIGDIKFGESIPSGTNAIGKLAANDGVDIGDVDVKSLPTAIQGLGNPTIDTFSHVAINLTTAADQVLVSSSANHQIWVYGYGLTCGDADGQTVSLQDEDNAALTGIMEFAQYGGISVPPTGNFSMPLFKLGTDKDLEIDITGGDVDGWLVYAIVNA